MPLRPALLWFHRYLGLLATVPLMLLGLSGAVLTFEAELDRAINPGYWKVTPQGEVLAWQTLLAAARKAYPRDAVQSLRLPAAPDVAAEMSLKSGLMISIDPYTARLLGSRRREQIVTSSIHRFHTRLLLTKWGQWITGGSTIILVILGPTGLILWWQLKRFTIKWSAPWRRVNYDTHFALGIFGLVPWMFIGLSGTAMVFESVLRPAPLTHNARPVIASSQPATGAAILPTAAIITPDQAISAATRALPGAAVTNLSIPQSRTGSFLAFMKFPEDRTPAGRSRIAIDASTAHVLWIESSRTAPAATRLWNLNRPIHTGDLWGWPTRLLACLASLALVIQAISGLWMWWPRKNPNLRRIA